MARVTGVVAAWNSGYGFIDNPEGQDVYVHYTDIKVDGFKKLIRGEVVEYELSNNSKGPVGVEVVPVARKESIVNDDLKATIDNILDTFSSEECHVISEALASA